MQMNETMLTPFFRAMITIVERNGLDSIRKSIYEINKIKSHWEEELPVITGEAIKASDVLPVDAFLEVLDCYGQNKSDDAKRSWENYLAKVHSNEDSCCRCYGCSRCISYFWGEVGEMLFRIPNKAKMNEKYLPIRRIPPNVERHLEPSVSLKEIYQQHKAKDNDNKLVILKGMSSSTPAILNSALDTDDFSGGGLYFRYNGFGVIIDPGYHFVQNMHHAGLTVLDVDAVVITHEHIDHNSDMRLIDDIHSSVADKNHCIVWYLDEVSYKVAELYREAGTGFNEGNNTLIKVEPQKVDGYSLLDGKIRMTPFPTKHIESKTDTGDEFCKHTFGCRFMIENGNGGIRQVAYTSDTRFFAELTDYVKDADIVVANISGVYEDDYMEVKPKDRHLGYYGCKKLIEASKRSGLQYFLISEFWNGKSDIRYAIPYELQKGAEDDIRVLPAENGMEISLDGCGVKCDQCGKYSMDFRVKRPAELQERVKVVCKECCY